MNENEEQEWMVYSSDIFAKGYCRARSLDEVVSNVKGQINLWMTQWAVAVNIMTGEEVHVYKRFEAEQWFATHVPARLLPVTRKP